MIVGVSPFQDSLWVFDTINYNVVRRLGPTPSSGGALTGSNGLAKNPSTGVVYIISKQTAVVGRILGKLNVFTGVVTIVGNLGDKFASITFGGDTLYGVTGNGASVPETLFKIDTTNASTTMLTPLGNGADGEIICYNSSDGFMYHWSGNATVVFEKFLPDRAGRHPVRKNGVVSKPPANEFPRIRACGRGRKSCAHGAHHARLPADRGFVPAVAAQHHARPFGKSSRKKHS